MEILAFEQQWCIKDLRLPVARAVAWFERSAVASSAVEAAALKGPGQVVGVQADHLQTKVAQQRRELGIGDVEPASLRHQCELKACGG